MTCSQCQGIEELFSPQHVNRKLAHYRTKGPDKTTRMLSAAIQEQNVTGLTLLDIGSGVGAIQYELLAAGVNTVTSVDASTAYISAARQEAQRRGQADRISYYHGDFVSLAKDIAPADIVTLDRVICCYHDMEKLVRLSAERARRLYGLVYPRDIWLVKFGGALENLVYRMQRSTFRSYVHSTEAVHAILRGLDFTQLSHQQTPGWQVVVYSR